MNNEINKKLHGFTIIELIIVIVIIGILSAIVSMSLSGSLIKTRDAQRSVSTKSIAESLELYYLKNGEYPGCPAMISSNLSNVSATLNGLNTRSLTMPKSAAGSNSIICGDITASTDDIIAYNADTSSNCRTGDGCAFFEIKYRNESNGEVVIIKSRHGQPSIPKLSDNTVIPLSASNATIGATVTSDGGAELTDAGMCWGLLQRPSTNCLSYKNTAGVLTALSQATIATGANPFGVAISPDGKSVYITGGGSYVYMYSRDLLTGNLAPLSTPYIATGSAPMGIVISPDGKSVYVVNDLSNSVSMFGRDINTGLLSALSTPTIVTQNYPVGIAISPDGASVYVTNNQTTSNSVSMYSRDKSSGILAPLSTPTIATEINPNGVIVSQDNAFVYVTNGGSKTISMYSRNTASGMLAPLSTFTISTGAMPRGIAISKDGKSVYAANDNSDTISIFSRITTSGILSKFSTPTIITGYCPGDVVISPDEASVYTVNKCAATSSMYSRNSLTGALSQLSTATVTTGTTPSGIAVSSDGRSAYVTNRSATSNSISMFIRNTAIVSVGVPYIQSRTGLPSGSTVYYRGYATNRIGTGYSEDSTFVAP